MEKAVHHLNGHHTLPLQEHLKDTQLVGKLMLLAN